MSDRLPQIANIQLVGEPYQRSFVGHEGVEVAVDCNASLDRLAYNSGYEAGLPDRVAQAEEHLGPLLEQGGYYALDGKLKHGRDLSFDETFSLVTFVCAALNRPLGEVLDGHIQNLGSSQTQLLQAVALLSSLSTKEAYSHLTAEEIAGLAAATIHLDTVERTHSSAPTIAFGGMGGDKGYPRADGAASKLFSLSTLSALALAVEGPTHKHHSYPNTSKVAGQSAIEAYEARSDFHSSEAFEAILEETGLLMSSCHNTRTLHTLSHALKGETINHVIGPLAFTMSARTPLQGFIGVNEKIHPQTIIEALEILSKNGYQLYDNSAVYCGTDVQMVDPVMFDPNRYYQLPEMKEHVRLDEIAPPPYATLAAFSIQGRSAGTYALYPEDFYTWTELEDFGMNQLLIPNTKDAILHYNTEALKGNDRAKSMYLAMTIGLGIFVREYLEMPDALDPLTNRVNAAYLRQATARGLELLGSGKAVDKLEQYVNATQRYAGDQ